MASDTSKAEDGSSVQAEPIRIRFRLLDGMILVAATAAAFGLSRWTASEAEGMIPWAEAPSESWEALRLAVAATPGTRDLLTLLGFQVCYPLAVLAVPFLITWTIALIPVCLVGSRPRRRYLLSQPGIIAAFVSIVAILFSGLQIIAFVLALPTESNYMPLLVARVPRFASVAISSSWITLLIVRHWHADKNWADRLGRVLGVLWVMAGFVVLAFAPF
jgi:hypothetical protein